MAVNARASLRHPTEIVSTGFAYPSDIVDNDEFFERCRFHITDDRDALIASSRMKQRYWCTSSESTTTLARAALADAMKGIDPDEIDVLIYSSCSTIPTIHYPDPDNPIVADGSPLLLEQLGRTQAIGIDLKGAYCAGFIRGLQLLDSMLQNENYRAGVLICSEVGSLFATAESNRSAFCFLVGDAAGAVVVRKNESAPRPGIIDYLGRTVPEHRKLQSWGPDGRSLLVRGQRASTAALGLMVESAQQLLARNGLAPSDIDWLLPIQTHTGAVDALCAALDWPRERCLWFGDQTGYAASASIPATLAEQRARGRIAPGELVLAVAVGSGMNSGAALFHA